jgi:hypothetical protein
MSLNPEPAAPEERAELNLPPKSYADAAEEALEPKSHANGTDGTIERPKQRLTTKTEDVKVNGAQTPPKQQTELEGYGQDATPKSPTAKGHRRKASRSSMGSPGRKHGEQIDTDVFEKRTNGHGRDGALISVKPPQELEKENLKRRNSELKSGRQAGAGWAKSRCVERAYLHTLCIY